MYDLSYCTLELGGEGALLGLVEEVYYWMVGVVDALLLLPLHIGLGLGLQPLLDEVVLGEVEGDGLVLVERILIKPETLNFLQENHLDVLQHQVDHCVRSTVMKP